MCPEKFNDLFYVSNGTPSLLMFYAFFIKVCIYSLK